MVQQVGAADRPPLRMTVLLYKAASENAVLLRALVPHGVLLQKGLGLKIDDRDLRVAPFLKCTKRACVAEVVLGKDAIDSMKRGKIALFILFDTPEAGIGIPFSLEGFSRGFSHLK